ncbi:arginase family protein [Agromyces sp. MMS24-JH15]|uniref:arginase family protein n=1 Tax=Agromyces sp. MMS24-JH15 TaxID=3243765 RepID=UPI00374801AC
MIAIIAAPSNLGLRPPEPGGVPGTAKAPEALREAGLWRALEADGARDAGVVLPGRYVDDEGRRPPGHARNEPRLLAHARALSSRIRATIEAGDAPLVIGGDCSLLLGAGHALAGTGAGLVHVDGHTDFRHPGNVASWGAVAGEDLAVAIGRHRAELADLDGRGPYFDAARSVHVGCRDDDEYLGEARDRLAEVIPASLARRLGMPETAARAMTAADGRGGYWLHVDVDVLDEAVMPAVDSPEPGGLAAADLVDLLRALAPRAVGAEITVFDPDLDPDGRYAAVLRDVIVEGCRDLGRARSD